MSNRNHSTPESHRLPINYLVLPHLHRLLVLNLFQQPIEPFQHVIQSAQTTVAPSAGWECLYEADPCLDRFQDTVYFSRSKSKGMTTLHSASPFLLPQCSLEKGIIDSLSRGHILFREYPARLSISSQQRNTLSQNNHTWASLPQMVAS